MFEVSILVPKFDNDGVAFVAEDYDSLAALACDLFGGYSCLGNASGGWKDDAGKLYVDQHLIYAVCVNSIKDFEKVVQFAEVVKTRFRQLAVYLRYLGQAEIL